MTRAQRIPAAAVTETGRTVRGLPVLLVGHDGSRSVEGRQYETRGPWAVTLVFDNDESKRWTVTHLPTGAKVWGGRYHAHARRVLAYVDQRWSAASQTKPPSLGLTPVTAPAWMGEMWQALKDGTMDAVAKGRRT